MIDARLQDLGIKPVRGRYGPAEPAEAEELETRVGGQLPLDYRHFLLTYGYSQFDEDVSAALPGQEVGPPIAVFFGGGDSGAPVLRQLEEYEEQLPPGTLPIARDFFGNLFLLQVTGDRPGTVWYADFEGFETSPIASSFEEFLDTTIVVPDQIG
jgi:hypothetical protein